MSAGHVVQVVRSAAFAGVERYIVDVATELDRRGWQVSVVGGDPQRMRAHLPASVDHRAASRVVEVARALWNLRGCDLVHAHMTAAEVPAAILKRGSRSQLIVTRHFAAKRGRSAPARLVAGVVRRRVDQQISISRFVADRIAEPSTVIHNGVPPGGRAASRRDVVLVLQRLEPEKDTETALRAWAASGLGQRDWTLLIHGRGAEERRLRLLAKDLGIGSSVVFGGFTDDPRTPLASAAMLLATAPAEPFGLAVVEGMAEGTPVIATDSGAHPETLGEFGVYFPAGDIDACAAAVRAMADDAIERDRVGAALQRRQRAEFSVAVHVDRLEAIYLGGARSRRVGTAS